LRDVDLAEADLTAADLIGARFEGADLSGAILAGARLAGATFDERCRFTGAAWWLASFETEPRAGGTAGVDARLLEDLLRRHGGSLPDTPESLHPSVAAYLAGKGRSTEPPSPGPS
jgi:hypothetical protein